MLYGLGSKIIVNKKLTSGEAMLGLHRIILLVAFVPLSLPAFAEPGYQWEIGMQMEGMPFPKQKVCVPKTSKEPPVSADEECRVLSKKQSGNRFQYKADCKDSMMEVDIVSTPTSYEGTMLMIERSGEKTQMKMSGKRLGECEYKDRTNEMRAMQQQSLAAGAAACKDALEKMQGQTLVSGGCAKEKPEFCKRLTTPDGYYKFIESSANLPANYVDDPMKACSQDRDKLITKLCRGAVNDANFKFVIRFCPNEKPKLCSKAVETNRLNYVAANCPAERDKLVAEQCKGRMDTNQIPDKYQSFCEKVAAGESNSDDEGSAQQGASRASKPADGAIKVAPDIEEGVKEGVKALKGLFSF